MIIFPNKISIGKRTAMTFSQKKAQDVCRPGPLCHACSALLRLEPCYQPRFALYRRHNTHGRPLP